MRRFIIGGLVILMLSGVALAQDGDTGPNPVYSLAYAITNGEEVHVITYYDNTEWRDEILPARILFGSVDVSLVLPQWSGDGRTLYTTVYEPNSETIATSLYAFSLPDRSFNPVVEVIDPELPGLTNGFVNIESVSPDGRYALTSSLLTFETQLIDLQNRVPILAPTPCPMRVLAWQTDSVITACTGALFSEPEIALIDLPGGVTRLQLLTPPLDSQNPFLAFVTQARVIGDQLLVGTFTGTNSAYIGLLSLDTYTGTYFDTGTQVQFDTQRNYLTYYKDDRLLRLNPDTGDTADMGAGVSDRGVMWEGNTLNFWRTQERDGLFEVVRVQSAPHRRVEHVMYSGIKPQSITFSPTQVAFALGFQPGGSPAYVEVYNRSGLIWVSDFEYAGSIASLQPPTSEPIMWSNDGHWLHMNIILPVDLQVRTVSVNMDDGRSILAPEDRALYMGASPDGQWWLYETTTAPDLERKNRLFVYDWQNEREVLVVPDSPLYENFQYPDWMYYLWSPEIPG